jgi:hypothetical protein
MLARFASAVAAAAAVLVIAPGASAAVDPAEYDSAVAAVSAVDPSIQSPSNSTDRDFVVGTSRNEDATLAMAAQSGPNGEDPRGQGVAIAPNTRTHFEVTCLRIVGNHAVAGGVVTRSTNPGLPVGDELLVAVRDTTLPGGELDGHSVIEAPAESCAVVPLEGTIVPHEHGNWVVSDAVGLP